MTLCTPRMSILYAVLIGQSVLSILLSIMSPFMVHIVHNAV